MGHATVGVIICGEVRTQQKQRVKEMKILKETEEQRD
jgi:hypothetical protein